MKILYYIHALPVGGAERLVTDYVIRLKEQGHDVTLVVNSMRGSFLEQQILERKIPIIPLFKPYKFSLLQKLIVIAHRYLGTAKTWKKIIDKAAPDLIHVHTFTDLFDPCDFPPERIVYTFHADVRRALKIGSERNQRKIEALARDGAHFFALSHQMEEDLRSIFHTDRISLIPNSVDLQAIRAKKYDRDVFLTELNIPTDSFVVGHVGRFNPVKNHEKLLRVFAEISKKRENSYLLLVGTGTQEECDGIRAQIQALDIGDRVKLLGLREDATAIMSILDAFLLPSLSESFSLVLVEAQAHGVRCVASDAIPPEVACNANCFRLPLDQSDEDWASLVLDDQVRSDASSVDQFDVNQVLSHVIQAYSHITQSK